jgi:hypothetical protein
MPFFSKPVTELTFDDLSELLGTPESDRLEYKRDAYGRNDDQTREMLKDISSMANHVGGYLLIGVEEDEEGKATEIAGIENGEDEASRMLSSCLASIEERILGLNCTPVPLSSGKQVIVCAVPRSTRAPHIVTYKGLFQCWKRHGRQKDRMSIEEIREACLRVENIRRGLEDFIAERRQRVLAEVGNIPYLLLSATPLVVKDEIIDTGDATVRNLMRNPPYRRHGGWIVDCGDLVTPSLYGLVAEVEERKRLELLRNGHVEFRVMVRENSFCREKQKSADGTDHLIMYPFALAEYPLSFLHLVRAIADHAGIREPIVIGLRILNARGLALLAYHPDTWGYTAAGGDRDELSIWQSEQHLELPLAQHPYPLEPERAAKHLADRVWQAFRFEGSPMFDEQGRLRVSLEGHQ